MLFGRIRTCHQDALVDSVKHRLPRLTHLRVVFYYDIDGVYKQSFKTIAHEEDLLPAAMRLLDAIRTLRYLFLITCGQREPSSETWYSAKAWRVAVGESVDEDSADMHSGSHAATQRGAYVEMGEEEAEEIVFREKLYSHDREVGFVCPRELCAATTLTRSWSWSL